VAGLTSNGVTFDPTLQSQRGALTMLGDTLYLPYGSVADCGAYHGWLVAVPVDDPSHFTGWATEGRGGGIWATGGVASDGTSVFAVTGNGTASSRAWGGQNAVLRFGAGSLAQPADLFVPAVWPALDAADKDLGGSNVTLFDLPGATPSRLAMAFGKNGIAYLLDRDQLGGLQESNANVLDAEQVMTGDITTTAAAFDAGGAAYLVTDGQAGGVGADCPAGQAGDLVAMRVTAGTPPTVETAWCAQNAGHGSPIVTVTADGTEPIVWVTGAAGSGLLRAYDGLTGDVVWGGGTDADALDPARLHRFASLIAIGGRLVVAEDDQLVVFKL